MRVERMSPVKLGDLAEMAEVMRGPLAEHLGERDDAELGVPSDAGAR